MLYVKTGSQACLHPIQHSGLGAACCGFLSWSHFKNKYLWLPWNVGSSRDLGE